MAQVPGQLAQQAAPVPEPSVCLGLSPPEQLLSSPHTWAGDPCAAEECAASSTRGPLGSGLVHLMLQEGPHSTNYYLPCSCTCPAQCHWTINISLSRSPLNLSQIYSEILTLRVCQEVLAVLCPLTGPGSVTSSLSWNRVRDMLWMERAEGPLQTRWGHRAARGYAREVGLGLGLYGPCQLSKNNFGDLWFT